MGLTKRQKIILNTLIKEYIDNASPVSSQVLEESYNFNVCSATIRREMQLLTKEGFLYQIHISGGRMPTDKGYRFFVDHLIKKREEEEDQVGKPQLKELNKKKENLLKFVQSLLKAISTSSSTLSIAYLLNEDFLWKEGWTEILKEPEFKNSDTRESFLHLAKAIENYIKDFSQEKELDFKVFIGSENPVTNDKEFSLIISRCPVEKKEDSLIALLGPKRMGYQRNISLISSIKKQLIEDLLKE